MKSLKIITHTGADILVTALSLMMEESFKKKVEILTFKGDWDIPDSSEALIVCIWTKDKHEMVASAIEELRKKEPSFQTVLIDMGNMNREELREYVKMGNIAIVSSKASKDDLLLCIEQLNNEQVVLCPQTKGQLIDNFLEKKETTCPKCNQHFSKTEQAIIETAKKGYSMKEAAEELRLSINTIAAYRSKIMKKADVKSMAHLISRLSEK